MNQIILNFSDEELDNISWLRKASRHENMSMDEFIKYTILEGVKVSKKFM